MTPDEFDNAMDAYEEKFGEYPEWNGADIKGFYKRLKKALKTGEPMPKFWDQFPEDDDI